MNDIKLNFKTLPQEFTKLHNNIRRWNFAQEYWKNYLEMVEGFNQFKKIIERKIRKA